MATKCMLLLTKPLQAGKACHLATTSLSIGRFLSVLNNIGVQSSIDPYNPAHNRLKCIVYTWVCAHACMCPRRETENGRERGRGKIIWHVHRKTVYSGKDPIFAVFMINC